MTESSNELMKKLITGRCLIAADVDKTFLDQGSMDEDALFLRHLAPRICEAADMGTNLAVITGNDMDHLCSRFLRWLIQELCKSKSLHAIDQFHFFCNSGGVYFKFPYNHSAFNSFRRSKSLDYTKVFSALTEKKRGKRYVRPAFVISDYLKHTAIPPKHVFLIKEILNEACEFYIKDLKHNFTRYKKIYTILNNPNVKDQFILKRNCGQQIELRYIHYQEGDVRKRTLVQMTLKPILSWRFAEDKKKLFGKDLRTKVIHFIQKRLDEIGLPQYEARPGGRTSIDITFEKLDKAYALEYLIDKLNLQGNKRLDQQYGSNAIYLGDEVIAGGGNDYTVTRIPGLLVLAVNSDRFLIPCLSHVLVPSAILEGPEASADVIQRYIDAAKYLMYTYRKDNKIQCTALEKMKREWFTQRIREKITLLEHNNTLSVNDLQTLHAFVTLMSRKDRSAKYWMHILVSELNEIMMQVSRMNVCEENPVNVQALGASYPEDG
jgi:hydroxymethylpyrimidine pyrophosphatase-like HAD family hydrolase